MFKGKIIKLIAVSVSAFALLTASQAAYSAAGSSMRLKDIAKVQGVRDNQLVGFGVVVGLNGSGDGITMTKLAVKNMMENLGITMNVNDINVDNIAAVIVTTTLPAFIKSGDKLDVTVSSVGDANSLRGGTLIMTPLKAADGQVYAVAQGAVSIGGYTEGRGGAQNAKGFPTAGRIPGGAIVEKEVPTEIMADKTISIDLNNPDFTLAARTQNKINESCKTAYWIDQFAACQAGSGIQNNCDSCRCCGAVAIDSKTVKVMAPGVDENSLVSFIAQVESLEVIQDQADKIVINEKTGTIVMGANVKVNPAQIAHGPLTVKIEPGVNVSQPTAPFGGGNTVVIENPGVKVKEPKVSFNKVTAGDIVKALNDMGVTPSDIIAILQALKTEGALQAEIVVM